MSDDHPSKRPRFDGTITLGHIIQAAVVVAGVLFFGLRLESQNAVQDRDIISLKERMSWEGENVQRSLTRIEIMMQRIETKLDTKVDK